jgi:hypothetical protein
MKKTVNKGIAALLFSGFALSACATGSADAAKNLDVKPPQEKTLVFEPVPETIPQARETMSQKERDVAEAAEKRWAALVGGDGKTAYSFFSDGSKLQLSQIEFEKSFRKGFWKNAKVMEVKCVGNEMCDVSSLVRLAPVVKGAGRADYQTTVGEKWIIQEGKPRFILSSSPR